MSVWLRAVSIAALAASCSKPTLQPMPQVNVNDLEPAVQRAITRAQADFDRIAANNPSSVDLGAAYGTLAMTYHAQALVPPAEVAYTNARALAPRDKRWPYLAGHLYNDSSRLPQAIENFEVALALDGNDAPTLMSLGEAYLQHGDFDKAQSMYKRLEAIPVGRAAALTGLGKIALAKRQYPEAIQYLEAALKLAPGANRLRQPLATAYQAIGERTRAEENLRLYTVDGNSPEVPDPLADALGEKVAASHVLLRRGQRFGKAGRFDLAEPAFRAAVDADPTNADALANHGISLANLGRLDEARSRLRESLERDNSNALAHLSLGVVYDRQGADDAAIKEYTAAVANDPKNLQAYVYLGDAQMRAGRTDAAVKAYREALNLSPNSSRIEMSLAFAYIKAGHYNEARKVLEAAHEALPANVEIVNALARVLATAPATPIRNGPRSLELAKSLFDRNKNPEIGQTYAMALAESGRFDEASVLQRETIIVYERMKAPFNRPFLERNLALYQQRKAAREGWAADDPVFQPRSPAARLVKSP